MRRQLREGVQLERHRRDQSDHEHRHEEHDRRDGTADAELRNAHAGSPSASIASCAARMSASACLARAREWSSPRRSSRSYTTGITTRVSSVYTSRPPTTVIANVELTSAPPPTASASGHKPESAHIQIITNLRRRDLT